MARARASGTPKARSRIRPLAAMSLSVRPSVMARRNSITTRPNPRSMAGAAVGTSMKPLAMAAARAVSAWARMCGVKAPTSGMTRTTTPLQERSGVRRAILYWMLRQIRSAGSSSPSNRYDCSRLSSSAIAEAMALSMSSKVEK